jgi:predicted Zn-dependent protease
MKRNNKRHINGRTVVIIFGIIILIIGCATSPLTGKRTMAFISNNLLFPTSFAQYDEFLQESNVVTDTAEAELVERVGKKLSTAAQKWLESEGHARYLDDYRWEYKLVEEDEINAWCMPGGKIVVYTPGFCL